MFNKKRRQINKSRQKASKRETSSRKATISSLNSSVKKELLVPILTIKKVEPKAEDIDIAIIDADAYCAASCLKKA